MKLQNTGIKSLVDNNLDYVGELMIKIIKDPVSKDSPENEPVTIKSGDRIAQAIIMPIPKISFIEVQDIKITVRGTGGLGSTGA